MEGLAVIFNFVFAHICSAWLVPWWAFAHTFEVYVVYTQSIIKIFTIWTLWTLKTLPVWLLSSFLLSPWNVFDLIGSNFWFHFWFWNVFPVSSHFTLGLLFRLFNFIDLFLNMESIVLTSVAPSSDIEKICRFFESILL